MHCFKCMDFKLTLFTGEQTYVCHGICMLLTYLLTYLLAYLLTYSTEQSPSWEANWFSASQEIPCLLCNPKVHYRSHKCPLPVPILSQLHPVRISTFHFLKIHLNIILPSTPRSPKWSLSFRFPHQNPVYATEFISPDINTMKVCKRE
jgi:hypothetical protein